MYSFFILYNILLRFKDEFKSWTGEVTLSIGSVRPAGHFWCCRRPNLSFIRLI